MSLSYLQTCLEDIFMRIKHQYFSLQTYEIQDIENKSKKGKRVIQKKDK